MANSTVIRTTSAVPSNWWYVRPSAVARNVAPSLHDDDDDDAPVVVVFGVDDAHDDGGATTTLSLSSSCLVVVMPAGWNMETLMHVRYQLLSFTYTTYRYGASARYIERYVPVPDISLTFQVQADIIVRWETKNGQ